MELEEWLQLIPRPVRELPIDLFLIAVLTLATFASFSGIINLVPSTRIVIGMMFVLILPGYAFISVIFPESTAKGTGSTNSSLTLLLFERLVMSIGLSISLIPVFGLVLNFSPLGFNPYPMIVLVSIFNLGMVLAATIQRFSLSSSERFDLRLLETYQKLTERYSKTYIDRNTALNVILGFLIFMSVLGLTVSVAVPQNNAKFTELSLLTQDPTGAYVAEDYPVRFASEHSDQKQSFVLSIGNHEGRLIRYHVVVKLQPVDDVGEISAGSEIDRFSLIVPTNTTRHYNHSIRLEASQNESRLTYLLYTSDPPTVTSRETAYRSVHTWLLPDNRTGSKNESAGI